MAKVKTEMEEQEKNVSVNVQDEDWQDGEEIQGGFIKKRITFGNKVETPGDIHLEPGNHFTGEFVGSELPEGFKTPVLLFRVFGEMYRCNSTTDLFAKLLKLCPPGQESPLHPVPIKIRFDGSEKAGKGTLYLFTVLTKKGWERK